jgi:hypothetical protein
LKLHKDEVLDKSKYAGNNDNSITPSSFIPEVKPEEIKRGQKSETSEGVGTLLFL